MKQSFSPGGLFSVIWSFVVILTWRLATLAQEATSLIPPNMHDWTWCDSLLLLNSSYPMKASQYGVMVRASDLVQIPILLWKLTGWFSVIYFQANLPHKLPYLWNQGPQSSIHKMSSSPGRRDRRISLGKEFQSFSTMNPFLGIARKLASEDDLNHTVSYWSKWSLKYFGPKPYRALKVNISTLSWT